jgi:hypothetical protein
MGNSQHNIRTKNQLLPQTIIRLKAQYLYGVGQKIRPLHRHLKWSIVLLKHSNCYVDWPNSQLN